MQDLIMGIVVGTVFWQVQVSYICIRNSYMYALIYSFAINVDRLLLSINFTSVLSILVLLSPRYNLRPATGQSTISCWRPVPIPFIHQYGCYVEGCTSN